jgi:hypothetical protein
MFGVTSEDVKNLSVAALIGQMMGLTSDQEILNRLQQMMGAANRTGVASQNAEKVIKTLNKS